MHVADASNPAAMDQISVVHDVLKELDIQAKDTLLVLNKVDRVRDPLLVQVLESHHPRAVAISAATRQGLDVLQETVMEMLSADFANALNAV